MSSQDGRQVDGWGRLPGRRAALAGCRVALQGQRASSWEQKGQGEHRLGCLFKKESGCPLEVKRCEQSPAPPSLLLCKLW